MFLHAVSHDLRNPVIGTSIVLNNLNTQPGEAIAVSRLVLHRVYPNLIANALKHSPLGVILKLNAQPVSGWFNCSVSDNGVGISPEQCEKIFKPYFWGNQRPKSVGLGLGLYLCQQIVQAHGGTISVESQLGQGTTFCFTLPISKPTT